MTKFLMNAITGLILIIGLMVLGAFAYVKGCAVVGDFMGGALVSVIDEYGITCPNWEQSVTITPLTEEQLVIELSQMSELVAAHGVYKAPYTVSNEQAQAWKKLAEADGRNFEKFWAWLGKNIKGDEVTVDVTGDVYSSVEFDFDKRSAVTISGKQINVVLQGPHILNTHVDQTSLKSEEQQGFFTWITQDNRTKDSAMADIDKALVSMACNPTVKTDIQGMPVRRINDIAKESATKVVTTIMKIAHPDYTVNVSFENETCKVPTGITYSP